MKSGSTRNRRMAKTNVETHLRLGHGQGKYIWDPFWSFLLGFGLNETVS